MLKAQTKKKRRKNYLCNSLNGSQTFDLDDLKTTIKIVPKYFHFYCWHIVDRGDERGSYYNFIRPPRHHASKDFHFSNRFKVWDFNLQLTNSSIMSTSWDLTVNCQTEGPNTWSSAVKGPKIWPSTIKACFSYPPLKSSFELTPSLQLMMVKAEATITHRNLKLIKIQLLREMPEICKKWPNGSQTDAQKSIWNRLHSVTR